MRVQSTPQVDMSKQYRYRSGGLARVLCNDRPGPGRYSAVVSMNERGAIIEHDAWGIASAAQSANGAWDLIEVKPRIKRTVWINVDSGGDPQAFISPVLAGHNASPHRIACIKVELDFEEGEGL